MSGAMLLLGLAAAVGIPITNEVFINGRSYGTGSELEPFMFKCFSEVYQPPLSMGIIEKGQHVKVVGSEIQMKLHMRGRCEGYGKFDYTLGKCDTHTTAADGETPSEEMTLEHPIQSYEILLCEHARDEGGSWQDAMQAHEGQTFSAREGMIHKSTGGGGGGAGGGGITLGGSAQDQAADLATSGGGLGDFLNSDGAGDPGASLGGGGGGTTIGDNSLGPPGGGGPPGGFSLGGNSLGGNSLGGNSLGGPPGGPSLGGDDGPGMRFTAGASGRGSVGRNVDVVDRRFVQLDEALMP